jgi:hypothetical protein
LKAEYRVWSYTMPGPLRATFFFEQAQGFGRTTGWSETHYAATAGNLTDALLAANVLGNLRVQMMGYGPTLTYIRVSDDTISGDSRITPGLPPQTFDGHPYYNQRFKDKAADFSYSSLLLRGQGPQDTSRKMFWLSGNPDIVQEIDFFSPQQALIGGADWLDAFNAWKTEMVRGPWGFKILDRLGTAPLQTVVAMALVGNPPVAQLTTLGNHGFTEPGFVKLYRFQPKGPLSPNGTWQLKVIDATNFQIIGWAPGTYVPTRFGKVRQLRYIVVPYQSVVVRRFGSHKRGRPFDQQRGRARPRARS